MQTLNRVFVFTKRILTKKIYIIMLAFLLTLSVIYQFLPEKSQSANIKVALCFDEEASYNHALMEHLKLRNSLYNFYIVDSEDALIEDVQSEIAECGYYIPQGFFTDYVKGTAYDNQIVQYVVPSSALSAVISETLFSSILATCSADVLNHTAGLPEYNQEFSARLEYYHNSDEIFTVKDTTSGEFQYEEMVYHIDLPILEVIIVMLTFSSLLGLLVFLQDKEKGTYKVLCGPSLFFIKCISIATAIMPILFAGIISLLVSNGISSIVIILGTSAILFIGTISLSIFIRKSTLLEKVLPLVMLICVFGVFLKTLI